MKIFVSFDFDNDRLYKYTLNMWASNANIDFSLMMVLHKKYNLGISVVSKLPLLPKSISQMRY